MCAVAGDVLLAALMCAVSHVLQLQPAILYREGTFAPRREVLAIYNNAHEVVEEARPAHSDTASDMRDSRALVALFEEELACRFSD